MEDDAAVTGPDCFAMKANAAVTGPDIFVMKPDAAVIGPDYFVMEADIEVTGPDCFMMEPGTSAADAAVTDHDWRAPLLAYLLDEVLPPDRTKLQRIARCAKTFATINGEL
jgi:hypothetical protein